MQLVLNDKQSYPKIISLFAILTAVFALGSSVFGYILLPFAASFYAGLLVYEDKKRRILSFLVPVAVFIINFFIAGTIYSLEAVGYVLLGLIIFIAVKLNLSKAETAFWMSLCTVALLAVSLIFIPLSLGLDSVIGFYQELLLRFENFFTEYIIAATAEAEDGILNFYYNQYEASAIFKELILLSVAVFPIVAFLISGVALKLFSAIARKNSPEDSGILEWRFSTPNTVVYFYIIVMILAFMSAEDNGAFALVIAILNAIFTVVYAYSGASFVVGFFVMRGRSSIFGMLILILAMIVFSSFALHFLAIFGAYLTLTLNKLKKNTGKS